MRANLYRMEQSKVQSSLHFTYVLYRHDAHRNLLNKAVTFYMWKVYITYNIYPIRVTPNV